jgi:hypothetical protein
MKKTKLERVLELMINEESDKAKSLLHDIFVEKSRVIYSDIIGEDTAHEEKLEEFFNFDDKDEEAEEIEDDENEIESEEMFGESDDEVNDFGGEEDFSDEEAEEDLSDEMVDDFSDEEADAPDAEEAMMNVEDALAELKAVFAELTGDESDEEEFDAEADDFESDFEAETSDEEYSDEEEQFESLEEEAKLKPVNVKRDAAVKAKSPIAKKNDMGGKVTKTDTKAEAGRTVNAPSKQSIKGPEAGAKLKSQPVKREKATKSTSPLSNVKKG